MLGLGPVENLKLDEQDSMIPNSTLTSPKASIKIPTKSYVDSLYGNSRNRGDLSPVSNNQDNEIDNNNLTNLVCIAVNRNPTIDNEILNKKYVVDDLDKKTVLRFKQSLQNNSKVSIENTDCNLTNYDRIQITDTTLIK